MASRTICDQGIDICSTPCFFPSSPSAAILIFPGWRLLTLCWKTEAECEWDLRALSMLEVLPCTRPNDEAHSIIAAVFRNK